MAWMDSNSDEIWNGGTFRLTFSYPFDALVPDISVPKSATIPIVNVRLTLTSWVIDKAASKVRAVILSEPADKLGMLSASSGAAQTALTQGTFKNPYLPLARSDGGYSKLSETSNVYPSKPVQTAVIPVIAIAAVIAALVGAGLIYLTLDKVEKLTESPSFNVFLIAISILIVAGIFIYFKKGLA